MIAAGYIVDEAIFSLFFFIFGCAFVLQLLVERSAKFDQKQLSQKQRLYEWKPLHKPKRHQGTTTTAGARRSIDSAGGFAATNAATTSTVSPGRQSVAARDRGSPPNSNRVLSPSKRTQAQSTNNHRDSVAIAVSSSPPTSPNKHSEEANTTSKSTGASTDDIHSPNNRHAEANAMPHRHTTMRVGPMQWWFHRLGLAMCVLQCIRMIDPYGIHGLLPFPAITFLQHNSVAALYSAGIMAFFFPLQLIQIVAFRKDTPWLRYLGGCLTSFAFLVANAIPIIYGAAGYYKYGRVIFNYYVVLSSAIACVVFDVFVHKVAQALQGLIDFRSRSLALKPIQSPPSQRPSFSVHRHQQNQSDSARSNLSNRSDQPPTAPNPANSPPTAPTQRSLVGVAEDAASEASVSGADSAVDSRSSFRESPRDEARLNFPSLSPHAPQPTGPATTALQQATSTSTTGADPIGSGGVIAREVISSSSVNTLASSGSTTSDPSTSVSPSASNLNLIAVNPSDAAHDRDTTRGSPQANRSRVDSFDSTASSQDAPRFVAPSLRAESDRTVQFAAGPARVSVTVSRRDAVAEGYKKVVQNLRRFQVLANLLVIGAISVVIVITRHDLLHPDELIAIASPDKYSGENHLATTLLVSCGVCVVFWYSYMPMTTLCAGLGLGRVKRRSKKRTQPQAETQAIQLQPTDRIVAMIEADCDQRIQDERGLVSVGPIESRRPSMIDS